MEGKDGGQGLKARVKGKDGWQGWMARREKEGCSLSASSLRPHSFRGKLVYKFSKLGRVGNT